MTTEIHNRISSAWGDFTRLKSELCNRKYCKRSRARLFDAVITPTVMYGCTSWSMTEEHAHLLTKTRRAMLRKMFYSHRAETEEWVDFIQRTTHKSEECMRAYGSVNWIEIYKRRKNKFAQSTVSREDNRWSKRLMHWFPLHGLGRSVGHPRKRWSDDLDANL